MWFGVELELRLNESENALYMAQLANGRLYFGPTHHTYTGPLSSLILKIPFFISRLNRQVCGQPFVPSAVSYSEKKRKSESDTDGRSALSMASVQNLKLMADPGTDRSFRRTVSAVERHICHAMVIIKSIIHACQRTTCMKERFVKLYS